MNEIITHTYDDQTVRWFAPDPAEQFSNPYLAMGNNPVMYVDPDGEVVIPMIVGAGISVLTNGISNLRNDQAFFQNAGRAALIGGIGGVFSFGIGGAVSGIGGIGQIALQTAAHGHLGGMMSSMGGGNYGSGFAAGGLGSLAGTGATALAGQVGSNAVKAGITTLGGAAAGGAGAAITGGNFWDGARNGAISAGLNHAAHSLLEPSREYTPEEYQRFSEDRKAKFIDRPKTALVQIDRQTMANYPTVGRGIHVENTTTTEIWGKVVYVKQKNLLQTMSVNDPIISGGRGSMSTTIFWRVYNYYNSGLARDLAFLNAIEGALNPGYHEKHIYKTPGSYPPGLMTPYLRWFNFGRQ